MQWLLCGLHANMSPGDDMYPFFETALSENLIPLVMLAAAACMTEAGDGAR